ncbi:MAG: OsmC family protein [Myxococcales bacterium]|nr:OsmC family protein [Myxococcales bacterium]
MSEHLVSVAWQRGGAPFRGGEYSREHRWRFDGGQEVVAAASPWIVPEERTNLAGVDPEEAFVASLSSCHMLWFLSLAEKAGYLVDRYEDLAVGVLSEDPQGRQAITQVTLRPLVTFVGTGPDPVGLIALHERAHAACFIANSVKSEVSISPREASHAGLGAPQA